MARKRRSYRRGFRAGKRRGRKGLQLPKLLDVSQIIVNADGLGYPMAAKQMMTGNFDGAVKTITDSAGSPSVVFGLALDNIFIGIGRKVIHATGGKWVRKVIA